MINAMMCGVVYEEGTGLVVREFVGMPGKVEDGQVSAEIGPNGVKIEIVDGRRCAFPWTRTDKVMLSDLIAIDSSASSPEEAQA